MAPGLNTRCVAFTNTYTISQIQRLSLDSSLIWSICFFLLITFLKPNQFLVFTIINPHIRSLTNLFFWFHKGRQELSSLAKFFFPKWGYWLTLVLFLVSLQAMNITAIIESAQVNLQVCILIIYSHTKLLPR